MSLLDHPEGDYRFLPGIAPYSCGAVSVPGFEVVHAVLQRPLPYRAGFDRIAGHLAAALTRVPGHEMHWWAGVGFPLASPAIIAAVLFFPGAPLRWAGRPWLPS